MALDYNGKKNPFFVLKKPPSQLPGVAVLQADRLRLAGAPDCYHEQIVVTRKRFSRERFERDS